MYKIMIYIDTHSGDKWFYYQENEKDYVAYSLHEIKETVLTLIDTYGKDNIKIVKQVTGEDMEGSVETFIYDSTDNYEELLNRPSINGVEIIGQLSLDDLGIQPAGDYATNERVDQVEAKVDAIDLEPYATMDYLDEVVAGIDFSASNENITGVKTFSVLPRSTVAPTSEDELTNKSYVDHGVEGCASKEYVAQYVEDSIANIELPEAVEELFHCIKFEHRNASYIFNKYPTPDNVQYLTTEQGQEFADYINKYITGTSPLKMSKPLALDVDSHLIFTVGHGNGHNSSGAHTFDFNFVTTVQPTASGSPADKYKAKLKFTTFSIYLKYENGTYTAVDNYASYFVSYMYEDYLALNNTTTYTPTGDYNPATKKYVDDAVANAGSEGGLTGVYTLHLPSMRSNGSYTQSNTTEEAIDIRNKFSEIFTQAKKDGFNKPTLIITGYDGIPRMYECKTYYEYTDGTQHTYTSTINSNNENNIGVTTGLKNFGINTVTLWENDVCTCTSVYCTEGSRHMIKTTDVLTKTNTTSFTPTADYHPATKKYVDDSIAAIDIPTGNTNAIEQVETLPTGSEALVGTVYQYVGTNNASYGYLRGNYYICTKRTYLNKHNERKTGYSWVNTQLENIIKEIPMHEYRNTSGVNFLTPGEHQVWGGTTFNVASDLSKILKRYTDDYNSCLFLYSERLTTDTQEYTSVLFTVSYNTTIDNVQYQVLEGITHSIKNPGKTAHVILRTAINGFNDYSCSPVFIVTEQSGANLDNYYTKEEVDAAIAAAITGALEGEY